MFSSEPVRGRCKVICFHPRHDLKLARMAEGDVVKVVEGWKGIYREEGRMLAEGEGGGEGYVQIFEVGEEPPKNLLQGRKNNAGLVEPGLDDGC